MTTGAVDTSATTAGLGTTGSGQALSGLSQNDLQAMSDAGISLSSQAGTTSPQMLGQQAQQFTAAQPKGGGPQNIEKSEGMRSFAPSSMDNPMSVLSGNPRARAVPSAIHPIDFSGMDAAIQQLVALGAQDEAANQPVVARADGGSIKPGQTAVVGENGPELMTAKKKGGGLVKNNQSFAEFERNNPTMAQRGIVSSAADAVPNPAEERKDFAVGETLPPSGNPQTTTMPTEAAAPRQQLASTTPGPPTAGGDSPPVQVPTSALSGGPNFRAANAGLVADEPMWKTVLKKFGHIMVGAAVGPEGMARLNAAAAEKGSQLATLGIQNPQLLRTSPAIAQAVDNALGAGTAQSLVDQLNPDVQAKLLGSIYGVPLLRKGTMLPDGRSAPGEMEQLNEFAKANGMGVSVTSKGEVRFTTPSRSRENQDSITAYGLWNDLQSKGGMDPLDAAKRTVELGSARGISVPQKLIDYATAKTDTQLGAAKAAVEADAKNAVELGYAGRIAQAREEGTRTARQNMPMSEEELRSVDAERARSMGGVVYGREMSDNDLITAAQSQQRLQLTPEGNYVGVPENRMTADERKNPLFLYPNEVQAKRLSQKMADKTTSQTQNAQVVLSGLNDVDVLDALSILTDASDAKTPEAIAQEKEALKKMSPGERFAKALEIEFMGQTSGRASMWTARRFPDPDEVDASGKLVKAGTQRKAAAILALESLATAAVKAMGDTGQITEPDKKIFMDRLGRITKGVASRQEAQLILGQIRALMTRSAAGPMTREEFIGFMNSTPNPSKPPAGYTAFSGGSFKVNP